MSQYPQGRIRTASTAGQYPQGQYPQGQYPQGSTCPGTRRPTCPVA